jgi:hypothetical protein
MRINGASRQNAAPQEPQVTGEDKLGINKDRQIAGQSIFNRLAKQRALFGTFARSSFSQQFDRAGLRTAWKYAYLFRAGDRLTRYVE